MVVHGVAVARQEGEEEHEQLEEREEVVGGALRREVGRRGRAGLHATSELSHLEHVGDQQDQMTPPCEEAACDPSRPDAGVGPCREHRRGRREEEGLAT